MMQIVLLPGNLAMCSIRNTTMWRRPELGGPELIAEDPPSWDLLDVNPLKDQLARQLFFLFRISIKSSAEETIQLELFGLAAPSRVCPSSTTISRYLLPA